MSEPVRLYIVTDNADEAAFTVFGEKPQDVPAFARIVSDPAEIARLPRGAVCQGRWYSPRNSSLQEIAFIDRRLEGGIEAPDCALWDMLITWLKRRDAARLARAMEGAVNDDRPEPPASIPETKTIPQQRTMRWK